MTRLRTALRLAWCALRFHDVLSEEQWVRCATCHPIKRRVRTQRLPTTAELTGSDPDFTGGLSTEEYIRQLRRSTK